jgi:hypothetical protein
MDGNEQGAKVIITARRAGPVEEAARGQGRAQQAHRKEARTRLAMNTVGRNAGEHDFSER